jgi:hypothetical protein
MVERIFMPLLDEGVEVYRPVQAYHVSGDVYIVLRSADYDPSDETWEFPPGSVVVCQKRTTADGEILAAVRRQELGKQSA